MKFLCIMLMLTTITLSLIASTQIDSLESKLNVVVAEEKIKVLNALSQEYLFIAPKQTIIYSVQAVELAITFNDDINKREAYNNCANAYAILKDYNNSTRCLEMALSTSEIIGEVELILFDIYRIADVYSSSKNHTKSIEFYNKALKINEIMNNRSEVALALNRIGLEYKKAGQYKKASEFFIRALKFEEENVRVLMRDEYKQISEFYATRGEGEKALEYHKLFTSISDTIASAERSQKISDMQNLYEEEQRKRKIELLQKEKENRDLEIINNSTQIQSQKFTQKVLIFGFLSSVIFFIVASYFAYTSKKKSKDLEIVNAKLEQIAKTDPLTDLSNRRDMIEKIVHEQKRFGRNGKSFVLVMADIDDFKKINDENGHDCGDFILESLAKQMRSTVRKQDLTGRWGGEEFLMLLPETEIEGGVSLADKLRKDIEATSYVFNEIKLELTMTFGVSVYDRPMNIDKCIKMADEALYKGKEQGKNCVIMTKPKEKPILSRINKSIESG